MELVIPHRLLQPCAFLERNGTDDAIRVGGDHGYVGHRIPVVADEDQAIVWIVGQFVGAIDAARADGLNDPRRTQIQIDNLRQAVSVPGPEFVIVGHEHAVRSGAVGAHRTDKPRDARHI